MSENDSVANANGQGPITIIEHGGKEYELAPLRLEDMGAVEKFAKAQHRSEVVALMREMGDLLTVKERSQMMGDLVGNTTDETEPDSQATIVDVVSNKWTWLDEMASPAVINFVIVLRLRKTYPDMTKEQATDIVTVQAIAECREEMSALLGLDAFTSGEDGEGEQGEAPSA